VSILEGTQGRVSISPIVVRLISRGDKTMKKNALLWTIQGLLAALFLFAGGMKLVMPIEQMVSPVALSGWFIRFLGTAEVLGAIGLILPGMLRIHRELTPIAATGLVIIMIGATVISAVAMGVASAILPMIAGLLAASVAYGRWPISQRAAHGPDRSALLGVPASDMR
jgi:hypothetical protein